jgi:protein-L-isoaspartate(D-aspartate) O-methyltransferase
MRNISAPQRSQITLSSSADGRAVGVGAVIGSGLFGSGIGRDYKLKSMDRRDERERMVGAQIAARGIRDERVLQALREVPRHLFVPDDVQRDAYGDRPLPIGGGQTISQPYMVALMTEALAPRDSDTVLEVGTGSGYQTAILSRLARRIVTIERLDSLSAHAASVLASLAIDNVTAVVGDGSEGYPPEAPYDRIIVTAGAPSVPPALKGQLADGGRLVIPVGPPDCQQLTILERHGTTYHVSSGEACVFVPLIGRQGWTG